MLLGQHPDPTYEFVERELAARPYRLPAGTVPSGFCQLLHRAVRIVAVAAEGRRIGRPGRSPGLAHTHPVRVVVVVLGVARGVALARAADVGEVTRTLDTSGGPIQADPEERLSAEAKDNPFRFQGFYYDSGVKDYDMQARHYRPAVGRFTSQDRFESARGDFNLQSDPLTQNRYVFGGANPVKNIEFDGHLHCAAALSPCHHGNVFGDTVRGHPRHRTIRREGGGPGRGLGGRGGSRSGAGGQGGAAPRTRPRPLHVGTRGGCGVFGPVCFAGGALGPSDASGKRWTTLNGRPVPDLTSLRTAPAR